MVLFILKLGEKLRELLPKFEGSGEVNRQLLVMMLCNCSRVCVFN